VNLDELIRRFFGPFQVTQPFGVAEPQAPSGRHTGVDIGEPIGTPIHPTERGRVAKIFRDRIGGIQEEVAVNNDFEEIFAHLSDTTAHVGDVVGPSDVIGHSGATGNVTGPHLHFEVRNPGGQAVDPIDFLQHEISGSSGGHVADVAAPPVDTSLPGDTTCIPGFHLETITIGPLRYNKCVPDKSLGDSVKSSVTDPLANAIGSGVDSAKSGIVKFAIAGAVVVGVVMLARSGARRALE
jgi:peptidase M23-like protein